jgi:hypothetical protein
MEVIWCDDYDEENHSNTDAGPAGLDCKIDRVAS